MTLPQIYIDPPRKYWPTLAERCVAEDTAVTDVVNQIISQVAQEGDTALRKLCKALDGFEPDHLEVSPLVIDHAEREISKELKSAIDLAMRNIRAFHAAQMPAQVEVETTPGVRCLQRPVPIQRVGLYIPGGRAPLFSTVLMLAIPAKLAGCKQIVLCTPTNREGVIAPEILYCAHKCGIDAIYAVGGAQAIAAMALGTESIPKVDKIFGPGNRYVTRAKEILSSRVAIDMPAGPSEVMVLADDTANPAFVAADFLSQCEHGPDSQALLVCKSQEYANRVIDEIKKQVPNLSRKAIVEKSLEISRIIVLRERREMVEFANVYAPEHLIISVSDPWQLAEKITAAGSVFIGHYSPESAGDYASGTNHTLPTSGWATAYSGVNIDSFMRKITFQELTPDGLDLLSSAIITMAMAEGLDGHANAVKIRQNK
ncbi:MAG: histidinol dehydrogenase [Bacteroidales bacterium]|nr:histidinol dehydrogenase [Bacteroidales bacterium]